MVTRREQYRVSRETRVHALQWQITMFEILIGRTPFETNDMEHFSSPEELIVYYERTRKGVWMGQWSIPEGGYKSILS